MKCQSLFSVGKIRKKITNLSSAEFAQRVVRVTRRVRALDQLNIKTWFVYFSVENLSSRLLLESFHWALAVDYNHVLVEKIRNLVFFFCPKYSLSVSLIITKSSSPDSLGVKCPLSPVTWSSQNDAYDFKHPNFFTLFKIPIIKKAVNPHFEVTKMLFPYHIKMNHTCLYFQTCLICIFQKWCYRSSIKVSKLDHYENTPIQIYRKFHLQKLKIFR